MKPFDKFFPFFLAAGILINANGLLNDILEPDGALYATIAKHIVLTGDWINLFGDGHDWLDKPHFHFWITAASFKLFGISAFAYKLPAFVFWLAGIWYTFLLGKRLFDVTTAKVAVIIYVFALHGVLNNFDVRAEPYLTTLSIGAIYYFYKAAQSSNWKFIFLTAIFAACAIMTKGIFVLITIGGGFVIHWALSKQWKQFMNYRWWVMALLILLFITPELYSLYVQFDLHPEKVVFGKTNVSGLKFFFWDSQFGRFFNSGPIAAGHGDKTFFLHTTLWAFLPWSILLYIAVFKLIRNREKEAGGEKWIVYGSAAITFLLFSLSGFQLPHYIVILFPHFSIITAAYLVSINSAKTIGRLVIVQNSLLIIAALAVCGLSFFSGFGNIVVVALIAIGLVFIFLLFFKKQGITTVLALGVTFCLVLFIFMHNFFYPPLLQYQAGMVAGKWLNDNKQEGRPALFKSWSYSYEFYAPGLVKTLHTNEELENFLAENKRAALYTSKETLEELRSQGYNCQLLQTVPFFHISMLTGKFLNPKTRSGELVEMVLVGVEK